MVMEIDRSIRREFLTQLNQFYSYVMFSDLME